MKSTVWGAAAMAAAALVSGCATGPSYQEVSSAMPTLSQGAGRVFFYRSASPFGAAIQPELKVDDEVVGHSKPGGFFYVDRKAGPHLAAGATEVDVSFPFELKAGETRYIRTSISMGILAGRLNFEEQPAATGQAALASLSYTGDATATPVSAQAARAPAIASTTMPTAKPATRPATVASVPAPASVAGAAAAVQPAQAQPGKAVTLDDLRYLLPAK